MIRGNPAPPGFAASVSGWLRVYVMQERTANPSAARTTRERLDVIDACASTPVGVGDADPRIRILALANDGPRWEPGQEQTAVIHAAGHKGEANGDKLLNALAHAAVLDMQRTHYRTLERAKKNTEAAPSPSAMVDFERDRADGAERVIRELEEQLAAQRQAHIAEKARRRELQAALSTGGLPVGQQEADGDSTVERPAKLPRGIRYHGAGFQFYYRDRDGKQRAEGGFDTAEEAVAARDAKLAELKQPTAPSSDEIADAQAAAERHAEAIVAGKA